MTPLADIIRAEIQLRGPLPFARFMELALYHPEFGYYERERGNVGRAGDFYTSVSVGPLFGELLAFQFSEWLGKLRGNGERVALVEAGAHDGRLAADVLGWLRRERPAVYAGMEYVLLEPSTRRRAWQAETLQPFGERVRWVDGPEALHGNPVRGVLFSNELLDAFPAHRYGWDAAAKHWFEWGVTAAGEGFGWTRLPGTACPLEVPPELAAVLPDGYVVETSPAAQAWWRSAAAGLGQGWLLAVDYGLTADELISPARLHGTLRAYSQHRVGGDLLAHPGEQDLTAHVHFSAIQTAGESAGLVTEELVSQARFLTGILARAQPGPGLGAWDAARTRQFQTLTHPEHLGRPFRVLIQKRL